MTRVVLVTGVAGGIGSGTARVFSESGWRVVGVDCKPAAEQPFVDRYIEADIADPEAPAAIFRQLRGEENRLDALVNNAALMIVKPLVETTPEEWDRTMSTNVRSVFQFVRESCSLLQKSSGSIVNVSSVHAVATSAGLAAYVASKGAILSLTRAMALELGEDGVRVNAVLPGAVDTPMLHDGLSRGAPDGSDVEELVREFGKKHVLGRVGKPEEIGRAILFLADSEQSSFITGQALVVDGGATARLSTE